MSKLQTIDEILIECGITHLTGKEHDAIIVAFNKYSSQDNKTLIADNIKLTKELAIAKKEKCDNRKDMSLEEYKTLVKQNENDK